MRKLIIKINIFYSFLFIFWLLCLSFWFQSSGWSSGDPSVGVFNIRMWILVENLRRISRGGVPFNTTRNSQVFSSASAFNLCSRLPLSKPDFGCSDPGVGEEKYQLPIAAFLRILLIGTRSSPHMNRYWEIWGFDSVTHSLFTEHWPDQTAVIGQHWQSELFQSWYSPIFA